MDSITTTEDLCTETKMCQENILLEIIKELCSDNNSKVSATLAGKVNRIIADCDLTQYTSLHKLSTADESTSTLLGLVLVSLCACVTGLMRQTAVELTFDEQAELNQAIIQRIQTKLPMFTSELDKLKQNIGNEKKSRQDQIREFQESLDDKLNTLKEQEEEKVELMMEWLNHRLQEVSKFSSDSSELLTLKTKILELKSKILHLQILQNIFTETNQSIKAYSEVHKDLKQSIKETEHKIKQLKEIIETDD